jgi:signal transduction histidine kinase
VKRFQLTLIFIAFSALTIGAGAIAMNMLTSASAENSLLRLAEEQSERDAHFIAKLVGQMLANDAPDEEVSPPVHGAPADLMSPAFSGRTLLIDAPTVLDSLEISNLAVYDTSGSMVWTSGVPGAMDPSLSADTLASTLAGETVSRIVHGALYGNGREGSGDSVFTYIPLIGEESGRPVQVLGVSRPVPAGVASLVEASRNSVLRTTLFSLSAVFVVLLVFVMTADVRIWRRNQAALALEREQQAKLGIRNEELKQLSDAKSRFLSSISHELSTPLASVVSFIDLVLRNRSKNLSEKQIEQLRIARRNGDQLARLVADLSDASRIDRGALEVLYEEFSVNEVFHYVVESFSHQIKVRGQQLVTEIEPDAGRMNADRGRLIQVISNLVGNASKYSPEGSVVRLTARVDAGELYVEVQDEGIGISEEDQKQLFTMFFRANNEATRRVPGTGIGLVVAKEIIEHHGGRISLQSKPGEGTTVSFAIPLRPPAREVKQEAIAGVSEDRMAA